MVFYIIMLLVCFVPVIGFCILVKFMEKISKEQNNKGDIDEQNFFVDENDSDKEYVFSSKKTVEKKNISTNKKSILDEQNISTLKKTVEVEKNATDSEDNSYFEEVREEKLDKEIDEYKLFDDAPEKSVLSSSVLDEINEQKNTLDSFMGFDFRYDSVYSFIDKLRDVEGLKKNFANVPIIDKKPDSLPMNVWVQYCQRIK